MPFSHALCSLSDMIYFSLEVDLSWGMVVHTYNPSTRKAVLGVLRIPDHPGLQRERPRLSK